jgi:hypothetical protein
MALDLLASLLWRRTSGKRPLSLSLYITVPTRPPPALALLCARPSRVPSAAAIPNPQRDGLPTRGSAFCHSRFAALPSQPEPGGGG